MAFQIPYVVFEVPFDSSSGQGLRREFGNGHEVHEAEAAPATVNGECSLHLATGFAREGGEGAVTREPGDLP